MCILHVIYTHSVCTRCDFILARCVITRMGDCRHGVSPQTQRPRGGGRTYFKNRYSINFPTKLFRQNHKRVRQKYLRALTFPGDKTPFFLFSVYSPARRFRNTLSYYIRLTAPRPSTRSSCTNVILSNRQAYSMADNSVGVSYVPKADRVVYGSVFTCSTRIDIRK